MMFIYENGWFICIVLKDFYDGVCFKCEYLSEVVLYLILKLMLEVYKKVNSNLFIEIDDECLVCDFLYDVFFFINIVEIILFIEK